MLLIVVADNVEEEASEKDVDDGLVFFGSRLSLHYTYEHDDCKRK